MKNPILSELGPLLKAHAAPLTEYDLMQLLRDHPVFIDIGWEGDLALFQRHFVLMNGLYQLQNQITADQQGVLLISPLHIQWLESDGALCSDNGNAQEKESARSLAASSSAVMRDYYLDWTHYHETDAAAVSELLDNFWRRYFRREGRAEALQVLGLSGAATEPEIKRQYQKLASDNHPDKGGDHNDFVKIRQAYEQLTLG